MTKTPEPHPDARGDGISRRALLGTVAAAASALVVLTAGQSFGWLAPFNLLAPRVEGLGPQSLPVNKTAKSAAVVQRATDSGWTLTVSNGAVSHEFSRAQLEAMPQTEVVLPIACVEGWSTDAHWRGVRIGELAATVGGDGQHELRVTSLEEDGPYRVMTMGPEFAHHPDTLVALELNGETLDLDHGYPARIIAPNRPGVLQTKWLSTIEVLS